MLGLELIAQGPSHPIKVPMPHLNPLVHSLHLHLLRLPLQHNLLVTRLRKDSPELLRSEQFKRDIDIRAVIRLRNKTGAQHNE